MKLKYTRTHTHIKDKSIVFRFTITIEERKKNLSPLNETEINQLKNTAQQKNKHFFVQTSIRTSKHEQRIECKISF